MTKTYNTNPDQKFSREFLVERLSTGAAYVRFTKVTNGEDRVMHCTRDPAVVELILGKQDETLKTEATRKMTEASLRVFDLEKREWRTFNISTVYHVGDKA